MIREGKRRRSAARLAVVPKARFLVRVETPDGERVDVRYPDLLRAGPAFGAAVQSTARAELWTLEHDEPGNKLAKWDAEGV